MKRTDYRNAFSIGVISAILWFFVLERLSILKEWELAAIVIALPLISMLLVYAVHSIFDSAVFHKIVKFLIVGIMNTGVDFFIFNILIAATRIDAGFPLAGFKAASWGGAMLNSYYLNRSWTFGDEAAEAGNKRGEFVRFALVTAIGFFLNIGTTSLIANAFTPPFGISQILWDNIAAVAATVINLAWNFIWYRLFVFQNKTEPELV